MENEKIFIQIASYRDPELTNTINDAIEKAAKPDRLTFGICWQYDETENLDKYHNDSRFKIVKIHYTQGRGACWARHLVQKLYCGEKYTLQLDSHHRFIKNWDQILVDMLESLRAKSKKPILSTYVAPYEVGYPVADCGPCKMVANATHDIGFNFFPEYISNYRDLKAPIPARFISAHFLFADGDICTKCPYDPNLYFSGEEHTFAVRLYSYGYDLYHPHINVVYHEYTRNYRKKHWDDHVDPKKNAWYDLDAESKKRVRQLLGIQNYNIDLGIYGLGPERNLYDYQKYARLNWKTGKIEDF